MSRLVLSALVLGIAAGFASANPMELDVFTSFELGDQGPTFGASPVTATFSGGASVFLAQTQLYHDGIRSWQTAAGSTTTVTFETPASIVEFFALDVGSADAVVSFFDPDGASIGTDINLTNNFPGQMMVFDSPFSISGLGPIGRMEINNPGGGAAYTDSFGFSEYLPPPPGASPDNPFLPSSGGDGEPFVFTDAPVSGWFDPPLVGGYLFETDGNSNFRAVRPPPLDIIPDSDGQYIVTSIHGQAVVMADQIYGFPSAVPSFSLTGIDPLVDGGDPVGFPTFLAFDQTSVTFSMSPIPEPSTMSLAACGLLAIGLGVRKNRRRATASNHNTLGESSGRHSAALPNSEPLS